MRRRHVTIAVAVLSACVLLVALVLASCGGSGSTATTARATSSSPAVSQTTGGAIDAAALYTANCSGCHKKVPGENAAKTQQIVESGKESMPSFKDKLTAEEIAAVSAWVGDGGK
jgi:mono/diheme cytochrome c family protein